MTNEEAKQEAALLKWEEAGFLRNQIESILQKDGGIKVNHPSLKTSLTGYVNAHENGLLKAYNFDGDSLYVWNKLLDGIETNNGWTRIEPDGSNLKVGVFEFLIHPDYITGEGQKSTVNVNDKLIHDPDMAWHVYSHYKPINEEPKPIY